MNNVQISTVVIGLGIGGIGFVFGYLLYYAVRHTPNFNIELLSAAIGAVGGATVIKLLTGYAGWIGPYGLGLFLGFLFYFILVLILGKDPTEDNDKRRNAFLCKALLGVPK